MIIILRSFFHFNLYKLFPLDGIRFYEIWIYILRFTAQFQNAHVTFSFQHFHLNPNTLCNANIEIWPIIMNVHLMNCTALIDDIFYADFQLERNLIQTRIGP